jgi:phosphoserine phosphatase
VSPASPLSPPAPVVLCAIGPRPLGAPPDLLRRLGLAGGRVSLASSPPDEDGPAWSVLRVAGPASGEGAVGDARALRARMREAVPGADVIVVPAELVAAPPGLVVTDVDATLVTSEVIEELAALAGTLGEVARITAEAMDGRMDFAESLRRRVATLAGLPVSVFARVLDSLAPTPGAAALVASVRRAGGVVGAVSGGFEEVVGPLAARLGIDHETANRLEVSGGTLTGRVAGEVVTAEVKVRELRRWAALHDVPMERTVSIGDGANDVPMLRAAGLGVAFCAKPSVRARIADAVSLRSLAPLVEVLGLGRPALTP